MNRPKTRSQRRQPRCIVIAGANGAGKTTFAQRYLPEGADVVHFVNVDLIATGLSPLDPTLAALRAGRLVLGFWCIGGRSMVSGSLCPELAVTQPIERDAIYRRRRFPREVIEGCVRWYLTYRLSYRDLVALMAEWGVHVNHTTIMRWVHRYVPEYEKRWNRRAKPVGSSWRMDETYIQTRPKTGYLYRAVDKQGNTVDSLFQTTRGIAAAMAFFRKAVVTCAPRFPRKITLDGHKQSHWELRRLRREDRRWMNVLVRNCQYLNNIVEQDHRAIKGRCQPMLGFKSYRTAAVTLAGIELAHRIRKRQFKFGPGRWICWSLKKQWDRALA